MKKSNPMVRELYLRRFYLRFKSTPKGPALIWIAYPYNIRYYIKDSEQ